MRGVNRKTLNQADVESVYSSLMEQLKLRIDEIGFRLASAKEHKNSFESLMELEFCYLQLRKICELLALAILAAHGQSDKFLSKNLWKSWSAEDLLLSLRKLNPHAFPLPVNILQDHSGPGMHHIKPSNNAVLLNDIVAVYRECGNQLHVGSLRRLTGGKRQVFDHRKIISHVNAFVRLLGTHMILLPEINSVMVVVLKHSDDGKVRCVFAAADGPFIVDDNLQPFRFEIAEK